MKYYREEEREEVQFGNDYEYDYSKCYDCYMEEFK